MTDRYRDLLQSPWGKKIAKNLGLPMPVVLERYTAGQELLTGKVLAGFAGDGTGELSISKNSINKNTLLATLSRLKAHLTIDPNALASADPAIVQNFAGIIEGSDEIGDARFKVVIFDASSIDNVADLQQLYDFFHPVIKKISPSGRVVIIGRTDVGQTNDTLSIAASTAQRALLGFAKSLAKEAKKGISVNVLYVKKGLEAHLDGALPFFISAKSAYVSGQAVYLTNDAAFLPTSERPLLGKTIAVTGASRGIGAAISEVLARDGAKVICIDLPSNLSHLQKQAAKVAGIALPLDITDANAGMILLETADVLDGVVHNAGITKDKTLAKMTPAQWQAVLAVNLQAVLAINEYLLDHQGLSETGKIVCVSSIAGIAGNVGQCNYAASKAGIIGLVEATAVRLAGTQQTINAVAPGFIETQMTAAIPLAMREAGRRMNAMSQGGLPVDVAETIAWLLAPSSGALNGQVLRVCGQSLIGT